jgi:hypothetical protein
LAVEGQRNVPDRPHDDLAVAHDRTGARSCEVEANPFRTLWRICLQDREEEG